MLDRRCNCHPQRAAQNDFTLHHLKMVGLITFLFHFITFSSFQKNEATNGATIAISGPEPSKPAILHPSTDTIPMDITKSVRSLTWFFTCVVVKQDKVLRLCSQNKWRVGGTDHEEQQSCDRDIKCNTQVVSNKQLQGSSALYEN